MRGLKGRAAIVTGGGSGIGEAICHRLVDEGVKISILDRNVEGADRVAGALRAAGGDARFDGVDISDYAAVQRCVARAEAALGPTEILINCAGWDKVVNFASSTVELHDQVIAINLKGPVNVMHQVAPGMAERKYGRVVSISSDAGRVGSSGQAVYSACKAGVIAMSKTLAREFARSGVTFNAVAPGPTKTPMMDAALDDGDSAEAQTILNRMIAAVPLKRIGLPEDVAGIVAFLASDEASFITGQVVSVSGGLTMHG
ncbi:SDR family NAD(P)-dependent oxidoreductase [Chelatococcus reniformis]|uniref:Acetoacetyl-CoA reductase n=1 Tax=Chelatococcus reniformis TaxID=1494448 RepID=A0A916UMT1_9HYPH|nr:SDR family oxidoreductase [Chelatococcus reniformis]GGC77781.1 acetoacetyl-CoA reductase [Chelatococcus reniformis]